MWQPLVAVCELGDSLRTQNGVFVQFAKGKFWQRKSLDVWDSGILCFVQCVLLVGGFKHVLFSIIYWG